MSKQNQGLPECGVPKYENLFKFGYPKPLLFTFAGIGKIDFLQIKKACLSCGSGTLFP
jgi:hypothetical protein